MGHYDIFENKSENDINLLIKENDKRSRKESSIKKLTKYSELSAKYWKNLENFSYIAYKDTSDIYETNKIFVCKVLSVNSKLRDVLVEPCNGYNKKGEMLYGKIYRENSLPIYVGKSYEDCFKQHHDAMKADPFYEKYQYNYQFVNELNNF